MADGAYEDDKVVEKGLSKGLEVHFAVWRNDFKTLERLIESGRYDLETRDPKGFTPLMLAYALGSHRAALMLIAGGAYAKSRMPPPHRWEVQHCAALSKNPHLTRTAVLAMLQETDASWARRVPAVAERLGELPDFEMLMTWEFSSWIPLVGSLLPKDTMRIRKRGGSIRIDYTLLGMEGLSWGRGNISFLICADDPKKPGGMYVMDHEHRTAGDARLAFTDPQDYQVQDWARKLMTRDQKVSDWWSRSVEFERANVRGWLGEDTGEPLSENVGPWEACSAFTMRNVRLMEWSHKPLLRALPLESWWREEYSQAWRQAQRGEDKPEGTPSAASIAEAAAATYGNAEAPEAGISRLHSTLEALQNGLMPGDLPDAETSGDDHGHAGEGIRHGGLPSTEFRTFKEHFEGQKEGWVDPADEEEHNRGRKGVVKMDDVVVPDEEADESLKSEHEEESPTSDDEKREVSAFLAQNISENTKHMDFRVNFTRDFPLTVRQILPVAECLARTGRHFANFERFFESKLPKDHGFPVRFSIPVFPFVTAVVTFGECQLVSPPEEDFVVPEDYAMGEYVERGLIRQL